MRVFVSRTLKEDSTMLQQLMAAGYEVVGESLIDFDYIPFNYFPPCHWVFFYSPRCVHYFLDNADPMRYKMSKIAAVGIGTAKALVERGIVPDFIGNGKAEPTADSFSNEAFEQRVLFPQAKNSRQSVGKIIADSCEVINLVVYDNFPKKDFEIPPCEILVFTSPLNVVSYLAKYSIERGQRVIAIGDPTANALRESGILHVETAKETSEASMAELILAG